MKTLLSTPLRVFSEIDLKLNAHAPLPELLRAMDSAREPLSQLFQEGLGTSIAGKAFALKTLNLLLAKYHFRERSAELLSRPFGLVVDPANGCNLECPGCVHSAGAKERKLFDWGKGLLTEERFSALLDRYGTYGIQLMLCNYGEPTANLRTPRLIELAKSYLIQTVLSTNGTIKRFDADAYVRSGLDFMYLSIDGATQPVYEQFRKGGHIEVVFENIRKMVEAKKRLGSRTPILRWQFLAFEHNSHEIPRARELAAEQGVDQFTVERPFDVSWDVPGIKVAMDVPPANTEIHLGTESALRGNWDFDVKGAAKDTIEREFAERWEKPGRVYSNKVYSTQGSSGHTCSWLYKSTGMDANGKILPCCAAPRPNLHLSFGQFPDATGDTFNSPDYQRARQFFADGITPSPGGDPVPHCENCEWDQEHTEVGHNTVSQYFRTAGRGLVDADTVRILCDW
jgi:MoaA/NifB/PqqE/SkfB family radical SAM enzyme